MNTINPEDALYFIENAQKGDENALISLAIAYYEGNGIKQDYKRAIECYKKAAGFGHEIAQCDLAYMYKMGQGTPKDMKQAVYWYTKSAELGFGDAQLELGVLYHNGDGVKQDFEKSLYWYKKAADQGNAKAQENLAYMASSGEGMEVDMQMAMKLFNEAAKQGLPESQYNMGIFFVRGEYVKQDLKLARFYFEQAAEQGIPQAYSALVTLDKIEDNTDASNYEEGDSDEYERESSDNPNNASQTIVSDEYIFTAEEAMACFCVGAAIVKHEDMPLVPPGIFMLSDNEMFLIYKDLMMWAVYLLGIKSESNWTQIYADADDPNRLSEALKLISQFSGKKKTCASVFLRTIAGSDADEANSERRILNYHNYCIECGLREIIDGEIAQRLNMKMTIYNGYDYMWDNYAEYLDEDDMADCIENDEEFAPEYDFDDVNDEE